MSRLNLYVIWGVAGSGKSHLGTELSNVLGANFYDADEFHLESSIVKMKSGIALDDSDRFPWLSKMNTFFLSQSDLSILACSCLKKIYRQKLELGLNVGWTFLKIDEETVEHRLSSREDHFFPRSLIRSQFQTLELEETGLILDAKQSIEFNIQKFKKYWGYE